MRIAMVGAGGVGAAYGAMLAQAGHEVSLLARGAHLAAIRTRGLTVVRDGVASTPSVAASDDAADLGVADVVITAVKMWSTEEAAAAARPLIGPQTVVVTLQNGVDARERTATVLGPDAVVAGIAQISAVLDEPGVVVHRSPFARIIVGEADGRETPRLARFVEACTVAGIEARTTPRIAVELWAKFVFIASVSSACALFRAALGPIRSEPKTRGVLEKLIAEAVAVGRAEGVALPEDQIARTMVYVDGLPPTMRASMLDDLERGARLELPWLGGRVLDGGRRAGIPTPAHDSATLALRLHVDGSARG